jgi:F-type H+-transporting ATPase subunit b
MIEINATIVIQVIQFLILVFILNRLLFRPIGQVLTEREQKIASWEEKTQNLQETARLHLEKYEKQLNEERLKARESQEQLTKELKEKEEEQIEAVSEKAALIVAEAQQAIERERERLRAELRQQAQDLSQILAEKVLGRELT